MPATEEYTVDWDALARPFDPRFIELRPGATTKDGTKAMALAYADPRAYMERLDEVIGAGYWSSVYTMLQNQGTQVAIECRVKIGAATQGDVGHAPMTDPNSWTVASAQAFKRACTKFGLGRYLYDLAQLWIGLNERKMFDPAQAEQAIHRIYQQAGITPADWQPR